MEYLEAIDQIMGMVDYERPNTTRGVRPRYNLERIGAFLSALNDPHLGVPTVHITGTKGKGSTSAMVASVLNAAGYKPGLFTSPHLHTFRERIRVGGELISEKHFADSVEEMWPTMESVEHAEHGSVTLFELLTAMAFYYFRSQEVGSQVIEVGLGGRLDSTNLVQPVACGITSLGLDHTEILGNTIEQIATEKSGIIKRGIPVTCAPQEPDALNVFRNVSKQQASELMLVGNDIVFEKQSSSIDGQTFTISTPKNKYHLGIPLLGRHQLENAAVAIGIIESLTDYGMEIELSSIEKGFRQVEWPCRLEILDKSPLILSDGAHNPHSAARLVEAVKELCPDSRILLIVGVSGNKDLEGLAGELSLLPTTGIIATQSRHPRATKPETVAHAFSMYNDNVSVVDSVSKALDISRDMSADTDLILVTGSLFVAAEAREYIREITPEIYPVFDPQATLTHPSV